MHGCNVVELTHQKLAERQTRAYVWAVETYGEDLVRGTRYQALRFLEEAMELAQTQGLTLEDFITCAKYVSGRKVGDTREELGDVQVCLDIMAENLGLDLDNCHATALLHVQSLDPVKCRAKDAEKIAYGLI